jgi:hypothetical protein
MNPYNLREYRQAMGQKDATPDPALKGKRNGNCNREACQLPGAIGYNYSTRAWYCPRCTKLINEATRHDSMRLYGVEKLVIIPEQLSDEDRVKLYMRHIDIPKPYHDGEVLGLDKDGHVIQWDAQGLVTYNSGETVEAFDPANLSDDEKKRVGL